MSALICMSLLMQLLHFFIYFLIASLALFMHWGSRSPLVKADVQASFTGFGGISSESRVCLKVSICPVT